MAFFISAENDTETEKNKSQPILKPIPICHYDKLLGKNEKVLRNLKRDQWKFVSVITKV